MGLLLCGPGADAGFVLLLRSRSVGVIMLFSPKDSDPHGRRIPLRTGLPFTGAYDPLGKDKPFFPTLTKIFLIVGLGFLSWLATYTGLLELIEANAGHAVDMSIRIAMAFAVAMLMLMIIYLLDSLFSPISWWLRIVYVAGYVFLTLISVGFGFGFYWKYLEARSESTRSAESAVGQVQVALEGGQARLEQLEATFTTLTALSSRKAEEERTQGGTCPKSPPGDGPRRRLRDADAKNFAFAGEFVHGRAGAVNKDIGAINTEMVKLSAGDESTIDPATGTRNAFLKTLNKKLDLTITRFNALRTDPQLKQFRDQFSQRADQTVFDNGSGGTFVCPDPQLQLALKGVVKAIDGLPDLTRPSIAAVEGSEAIVEAFRRLTTTMAGALTFQLPPTPKELRELQQKAVRSIDGGQKADPTAGMHAGLGEHDFIPFFIAIFVDLCLLLVSINRPVNRMQKLMLSAHEARQAQVHQILSRVHTVHERGRSQRLDALHEAMFDWFGAQYVAVPLDVYPDTKAGPYGSEAQKEAYSKKVMEARYLATLLAALEAGGLVTQAPTMTQSRVRKKLDRFGSKFSDSTSFRVYRFLKGAWPAIVLDDMLGASAQLDTEARAYAAHQAEERRAQGPSLNFGGPMPAFGEGIRMQEPFVAPNDATQTEAPAATNSKQRARADRDIHVFADAAVRQPNEARADEPVRESNANADEEMRNGSSKINLYGWTNGNARNGRSYESQFGQPSVNGAAEPASPEPNGFVLVEEEKDVDRQTAKVADVEPRGGNEAGRNEASGEKGQGPAAGARGENFDMNFTGAGDSHSQATLPVPLEEPASESEDARNYAKRGNAEGFPGQQAELAQQVLPLSRPDVVEVDFEPADQPANHPAPQPQPYKPTAALNHSAMQQQGAQGGGQGEQNTQKPARASRKLGNVRQFKDDIVLPTEAVELDLKSIADRFNPNRRK